MAKPARPRNATQARHSTTSAQSRMATVSSVINAPNTRTCPTRFTSIGVTMQEAVNPTV